MRQTIHFDKLIVNPENYRFDSVGNESEAIDLMLKEKGAEILKLAQHILINGLDEAKDFRVLEKESGKYIVLDGNRRMTAIKCLHNPSLIKDEKLRKSFENFKKQLDKQPPTHIQSFLYKDQKSANEWIRLDHTGKNQGVGQDAWSATAKERFLSQRKEGKLTVAMQAVEIVEKELNKTIDKKRLKISTINRILSNPDCRSYLQVNVKNKNLSIAGKDSILRLDKLFNKIIDDDVTVEKVYKTKQAIEFVKNLFKDRESSQSEENNQATENIRKTQREKEKAPGIFGQKLSLKMGETNNIYRDILDLYDFYISNHLKLSRNFPAMIRMSLRLLVQSATPEQDKLSDYVNRNFSEAKKHLTTDQKTTLSNNNIRSSQNLIQLLQSGAHHYTSSANFEQMIAISIIVGEILKITHGK